MEVKEKSYIGIQAFMVNDLHLSGNELIIYAVIFGFSQDGESWFMGSRGYLATWCQTSKTTVSNNLKKLCEKGLIEKRVRAENGVTFNDYRACKIPVGVCKKVVGGVQESGTGGVQKSGSHTIETDTREETIEKKRSASHFIPPSADEVRAYCQEASISIDIEQFLDHYEMNGWVQSNGQKIKSWKAAVRNWARRDKEWGKRSGGNVGPNGVRIKPESEQDHILDGIL